MVQAYPTPTEESTPELWEKVSTEKPRAKVFWDIENITHTYDMDIKKHLEAFDYTTVSAINDRILEDGRRIYMEENNIEYTVVEYAKNAADEVLVEELKTTMKLQKHTFDATVLVTDDIPLINAFKQVMGTHKIPLLVLHTPKIKVKNAQTRVIMHNDKSKRHPTQKEEATETLEAAPKNTLWLLKALSASMYKGAAFLYRATAQRAAKKREDALQADWDERFREHLDRHGLKFQEQSKKAKTKPKPDITIGGGIRADIVSTPTKLSRVERTLRTKPRETFKKKIGEAVREASKRHRDYLNHETIGRNVPYFLALDFPDIEKGTFSRKEAMMLILETLYDYSFDNLEPNNSEDGKKCSFKENKGVSAIMFSIGGAFGDKEMYLIHNQHAPNKSKKENFKTGFRQMFFFKDFLDLSLKGSI